MTGKTTTALVTGGQGFIGSHLSVRLAKEGVKVFALDRAGKSNNAEFNRLVKEEKIVMFTGDVLTYDYTALGKVDYIYHIAGKVSAWGDIEDFMTVNMGGTTRVLEYAKAICPQCFTYYSSSAVYGYHGYKGLTEDAPKLPFDNPYSITKLKTEEFVKKYCSDHAISYVIIRPGNVYGEYDFTSSHEIYGRIHDEKMVICANGKYLSCFVYVGNLADATVIAAQNPSARNNDYNVTDGNDETLREYFTAVAESFGVRPKFFNIPAAFSKLTAILVEGIYKLLRLKKAPLITKFSVWQNCADYNFDISKIKNVGHLPAVSMEEGVRRTANWYLQTYKEMLL